MKRHVICGSGRSAGPCSRQVRDRAVLRPGGLAAAVSVRIAVQGLGRPPEQRRPCR
jgi:hypothetical protein